MPRQLEIGPNRAVSGGRTRLATFATLVFTALATFGVSAGWQSVDQVSELLAMPVSPGTLALLIPHVKDARVLERWRRALWDRDAKARGGAARLLQVAGATSMVGSLRQVLETETDVAAAVEISQALLALGGPGADEPVYAAAKRLGDDGGRLGLAIAEAEGRNSFETLKRFRDLPNTPSDWTTWIRAAVGRSEPDLQAVARLALNSPDSAFWIATLNVASHDWLAIDGAVLEAALASSSTETRDLTWWHIAALMADKKAVPPAARTPPPLTADEAAVPMAFGRELAARVLKQRPRESERFIASLRELAHTSPFPLFVVDALEGPLFRFLTDTERDAINAARPESRRLSGKGVPRPEFPSREAEYRNEYRTMRTVSGLPRGLASDLLHQLACDAKDTTEVGGAIVEYNANRSVKSIGYLPTHLGQPCDLAARFLTFISATPAPVDAVPGKKELILLPMQAAYLTCADGPTAAAAPMAQSMLLGQSEIMKPKKIRMVNPLYPENAIAQRRQGVVFLEAVVAPEGCVSRVEVRQGLSLDLDVSALRAVSGWQYTPTVRNGQTVPVIMKITVQFSLQ